MKRNIELFTVLSIVGSWTSIVAGGSDEIEMSEDNIVKIFDFSTTSEDQLNSWWEVDGAPSCLVVRARVLQEKEICH